VEPSAIQKLSETIIFITSDCNPGIGFSIPGSGIEKFVIPGSGNTVSGLGLQIGRYFDIPTDIFYAQGPYKRYISTVESDSE